MQLQHQYQSKGYFCELAKKQRNVKVPALYEGFDYAMEAAKKGKPVFARDDFPGAFNGVSGLLESVRLDGRRFKTEEGLKRHVLEKDHHNVHEYCRLMGLKRADFEESIAFTYQEFVPGSLLYMVADSAVPGRMHIFHDLSYVRVQNGKVLMQSRDAPTDPKMLRMLTDFYQNAVSMDCFGKNQIHLVEAVLPENSSPYLVQYHYVGDFSPAGFEIDRAPRSSEAEAWFVRGGTEGGKEGVNCRLLIRYADAGNASKIKLMPHLEASFESHTGGFGVYDDIMNRRTGIKIKNTGSPEVEIEGMESHHFLSTIFKPKVGLLIDWNAELEKVLTRREHGASLAKAKKTGENQYITVNIVADGTKALMSRVG